jgi:HEAT repeat protein
MCGNLPKPKTYTEKLLTTIFSPDPTRAGMAIDILTKWLYDQRDIEPLMIFLKSLVDAHRLVMAARGWGHLGNPAAVTALIDLLPDSQRPFVARFAAAQALGLLGGNQAWDALQRTVSDIRPSGHMQRGKH